jgi:hypothetical protein
MLANKTQKNILGFKREEITRGVRKMRNKELHNFKILAKFPKYWDYEVCGRIARIGEKRDA